MRILRSFLANILGIRSEAARNGEWWEIDFIILILAGALVAGIFAWFEI